MSTFVLYILLVQSNKSATKWLFFVVIVLKRNIKKLKKEEKIQPKGLIFFVFHYIIGVSWSGNS